MKTVATIAAVPTPAQDSTPAKTATEPRVLKVKAAYLLTQEGRKAALLSGRSGREHQHATVRVPTHRMHLVTVDADGIARLKLRPRYEEKDDHVVRVDAPPVFDHPMSAEDLLLVASKNYELEQRWRVQRASKTLGRGEAMNHRERIAEEFLTDRNRRALEHPAPSPAWCYLNIDGKRMLFDVTKGSAVCRKIPPEAHRRFQADIRAQKWRNQQRRASEEALHEEKKRFVADWILAHGTPEQQARQRAAVLPMDEAIESIADNLFAPACECPLYPHDGAACLQAHLRRLPRFADVAVTLGELAHKFEDAKDATAGRWERAQTIQRLLPAARVTLRYHRLSWRKEPLAPALIRYGILAVQTLGPLTLRREYEAGE